MALRWPLEGHFELFWPLVAKWLSDGFGKVILSSSGLWWPNGFQMLLYATSGWIMLHRAVLCYRASAVKRGEAVLI